MEGLNRNPAPALVALAGLLLMAAGSLVYAISVSYGQYGLIAAAVGAVCLLVGAVINRRQLAHLAAKRTTRLGLGAVVASVAMVAVVVFLGAMAMRHHYRLDLTEGQVHTLAPQTLKLLDSLKQPITAYAFFQKVQPGRAEAEVLLEQYHYRNREFTYQFVNPAVEPGLTKKYQVREYGTVVLASGERTEHIKTLDEQSLTNALIRVIKTSKKTVYFLTGHGEASLEDADKQGLAHLKKAVEGQNYLIKPLVLLTSEKVPDDASVLVVAGPQKPLTDPEKERLAAYLARGGGLLLMLNPEQDAGLTGWLADRGVKLGNNLVMDAASRLADLHPATPLILQYGEHQITKTLIGNTCVFPLVRSVSLEKKLPEGVTGVELAFTSSTSWAKPAAEALTTGKWEFDQNTDTPGPFSLAAVVKMPGKLNVSKAPDKAEDKAKDQPAGGETSAGDEPKAQAKEQPKAEAKDQVQPKDEKKPVEPVKPKDSQMVVIGDCDFVANANLNYGGNLDLALGSISFLAEEEDLVAVTPRKPGMQPLLLQPFQAELIFYLPVVILPLIFAIIGVAVVIRRRSRLS